MKVEEIITNKIIKHLENGVIPWKKPWVGMLPKNFVSRKEYSGINMLLLSSLEYKQPYFITYKQAVELGGQVKKGEKGCSVVYWNVFETEEKDKNGKKKMVGIPFIRYYTVFNMEQCEGIEIPKLFDHQRDTNYEGILQTYPDKPKIEEGAKASYSIATDTVKLPPLNQFKRVEDYYATMYHELTHSTGITRRLARFEDDDTNIFGSESYSKEELIAELGSAFLCARHGIDNRLVESSAGYIQSWLKVLKNDPRFIIGASGKAQKAVNYMLGKDTPEHR